MLPRRVEGGWQIGAFAFAENPRWTVPGWCDRLVRCWAEMRRFGGGMGGTPVLPQAGGFVDQQGLAMDAFAMFDHWMGERQARR